MRIAIDIQGAQTESRYRGIGRYVLALMDTLLDFQNEHEYILVFNGAYPEAIHSIKERYEHHQGKVKFRTWFPSGNTAFSEIDNQLNYQLACQTYLAFIDSLEPDVVLITSFFEGLGNSSVSAVPSIPTAIISYDLIPYLNPETYIGNDPLRQDFYTVKLEELQTASALLTISSSSSDEISSIAKNYCGNITNIGSACDPDLFNSVFDLNEEKSIIERFGIQREFIFYCGGADERKNLHSVIKAFSKLQRHIRDRYALIFAGDIPQSILTTLYETAVGSGLSEQDFQHLGHVSDKEIVALYRLCRAHVFASLHEGFGLPTLEAMSCGAVCISSNTTSLPEVIGFEDAMFNPYSVDSLSVVLQRALVDEKWRTNFINHAKTQVLKFSWHQVALKTLDALELIHVTKQSKLRKFSFEKFVEKLVKQTSGTGMPEYSLIELAKNTADNFPVKRTNKNIYIDIANLEIVDAKTGIQRVVKNLIINLKKVVHDDYHIVLVTSETPEEPRLRKRGYFKSIYFNNKLLINEVVTNNRDTISPQDGDLFIRLNLDLEFSSKNLEDLDRYRAIGVKVVTVLYDILPLQFPEFWSELPHFTSLFENWVNSLFKFDTVICISKSVADEIEDYGRKNIKNYNRVAINHFHLGSDFLQTENCASLLSNSPNFTFTSDDYFLSVGTVEPRKNYALILDAFEILWASGSNLTYVIVGKEGWNISDLVTRIKMHPEFNKRLFLINDANDENLAFIYKNAKCVIAGSVAEGFGLPLIEAANHAIPIIANNIDVFREVAKEHAFFFDGTSIGLANSIMNWLSLFAENKHPRSEDMPRLNWLESAQQFANVLDLRMKN